VVAGLASIFGLASCDEPALEEVCPELIEGDLVISELRGPQDGINTAGQWVEVFNASDRSLDLEGVRLRFRKNDGSAPTGDFDGIILVRQSLVVASGQRVVIGTGPTGSPPPATDYAAGADFEGDMPDAGLVDLATCGQVVDLVNYGELPTLGTLTLDGSVDPDAASNDLPANFCTDDRPTGAGNEIPGTPGEANPPCDELDM